MDYTGYWIFYCNPKMWAIDDFLEDGTEISTWKVTDWQKDNFQEGQLGVVRVNVDKRTRKELNGKEKLEVGIYAVVQIIERPEYKTDVEDDFWTDENKSKEFSWRVKIKYIKNLLENPVLIDDLRKMEELQGDTPLIKGSYNSSWSISEKRFLKILELADIHLNKIDKVKNETVFDEQEILQLEAKYANSTPRIKEIISKKIERGEISKRVKKWYDYECQICKKVGLNNPHGFKKRNGEYYIETHHFFPVSELKKGSLGLGNLMTLCANHHRQVHYGNIEIISSDEDFFILSIDNEQIRIKKKTTKSH